MRLFALVALLLAAAAPALAQNHRRETPASLLSLVHSVPDLEAAKTFEATGDGLRHAPSGAVCPSLAFGTALTAIGSGPLPGLESGQGAVWCEYSDQAGPVLRLSIAREPVDTPVLTEAFCRGLPKALKLKMGPGIIPGIGKTTAPAQQQAMPSLVLSGAAVPLYRCSTIREPLQVPTVVADTAGLRLASGWTLRAVHTPAPPPCCNSYKEPMSFSFFLQPVLLVAQAAGASPAAFADPMLILKLKPGQP